MTACCGFGLVVNKLVACGDCCQCCVAVDGFGPGQKHGPHMPETQGAANMLNHTALRCILTGGRKPGSNVTNGTCVKIQSGLLKRVI